MTTTSTTSFHSQNSSAGANASTDPTRLGASPVASPVARYRLRLAQAVTLIMGVAFVATGLALLFTPVWFFEHIGNYPPFNRHYSGDLGAFTLAIGAGLVAVARNPFAHRALLAVAVGGSALHAINHVYDAVLAGATFTHWLVDVTPITLSAVLLLLTLPLPRRR